MTLADLRREYEGRGLRRADLDADPVAQFGRWMDDAIKAELPDATAMTLATASAAGAPSARIVLLKGYGADGFTFFTSYGSRKAHDLEANPRAAMVFYWQPLERQVRIEGDVTRTTRTESEAYFASRPRGSQISAAASAQSEPVADRAALEEIAAAIDAAGDVPCPDNWGGYRLTPTAFEFWLGRENRLHDRFRYDRDGDAWRIERLGP